MMKKTNTNKQVILGPVIALLALICGSAFANENFITDAQRIQLEARKNLAESMSQSMKHLKDEVAHTIVKPLTHTQE